MLELIIVIGVVSLIFTVLQLTGFAVLEWLFKILGLAGKGDVRAQGLSSSVAIIKTPFVLEPGAADATGSVEFRGELWTARCAVSEASGLTVGERCAVIGSKGLTLTVRKHSREAV